MGRGSRAARIEGMFRSSTVRIRIAAVAAAVALTQSSALTQRGGAPAEAVAAVRLAIGHGDLAAARRAAAGATGAPGELAAALVEIFTGRLEAARARLEPLARANPLGEAALELGLLAHRQGRDDEARRWLDPLAAVRRFSGPDDYLRLARAARAIREPFLANDAYQRVADVPRADIQTGWGDLFLEGHKPGDAVTSYRDALAADPRWVMAHLGMARALASDDPEAAAAALEAARKAAPDHPDVWQLVAERRMAEEDWTAAAEALDRMAAVRPESLEEAALRAALAFGEDRQADVEPALERAHAIDARSALPLRLVAQMAAGEYRFDDAAAFGRRAVERNPDDADARTDLGLYLLRTGEEADARSELEWAYSIDKSNPLTVNLLRMLDSLDGFEVVREGDLVFKFAADEADVLRPYAVPLGSAAYEAFTKKYGFTPSGPVLIEVFPQHDDFAVRTLGLPGLVGALGACFGRVIAMDSPGARPPGTFSWHATLWHEMAHVFTLQLSDYRLPRWLSEGISGYEEHLRHPAWGRELGLEFAQAMAHSRSFGVKGMADAFKRPEHLALAYFEASLLVEHLVAEGGDAGIRRFLLAYADGASDEEAFSKAFGRTIDQLDASFAAFVEARYGALRDAMKAPETAVEPDDFPGLRARAEAAPASFISQLMYGQALLAAGDLERAREPLERAARLAPQASGGASPRALLAQLAEKLGDAARARREWRQLLAHDHANVIAARRLVQLAAGPGAADDLEYGLRLVADLDPFDADVHGRLGRLLFDRGAHADAVVEFEVALAVGPANPASAHVDLGETLLKLGRRDEARQQAFAALKLAPTYARAQDLLTSIIRVP